MADNTHREPEPGEPPERDPFSLRAYLDRQHAEFARTGPTMAELLARADRRRKEGIPRELIVASIREDREVRS